MDSWGRKKELRREVWLTAPVPCLAGCETGAGVAVFLLLEREMPGALVWELDQRSGTLKRMGGLKLGMSW